MPDDYRVPSVYGKGDPSYRFRVDIVQPEGIHVKVRDNGMRGICVGDEGPLWDELTHWRGYAAELQEALDQEIAERRRLEEELEKLRLKVKR
jgi:hypothetical protein